MRSISRVVDVSINTVTKLLIDAGETCLELHNDLVRDVKSSKVQCDEIWSFCYAKERTAKTLENRPESSGDVCTWTALDADSKKIDNHIHALALYFMFYNFCRIHKSLKMSPAMAAGVSQTLRSLEDIAERIEARVNQPKKRGSYKKAGN